MRNRLLLIVLGVVLAFVPSFSAQTDGPFPFANFGGATGIANPCGSLPFTDSFSGSGGLGACWTAVTNGGLGPLAQSSGSATCGTAAGCISVVTGVTFPANESIQAVITPSGGYGLWCVQMSTSGNGPCFVSNYIGLNEIYGYVNGVLTTAIASCSAPTTTGDIIKISNSGTALTVTDVTSSTTLCTGTYSGTGSPAIGLYNASGSIGPVTAD